MTHDMNQNLINLNFTRIGTIDFSDGSPKFVPDKENDLCSAPVVYVFCSESETSLEVFYVGKAGKGIKSRMDQHRGGFIKKEAESKKHSLGDALRKRKEKVIQIWVRRGGDVKFKIIENVELTLPDLDLLELGLIDLLRRSYGQTLVNKGDMISRGGVP